jgi:uncharacterized protein
LYVARLLNLDFESIFIRARRLVDILLLTAAPKMALPAERQLIDRVVTHVERYMNQFDCSHDFSHIGRVVSVAHTIFDELDQVAKASVDSDALVDRLLDRTTITLSALLHDVGDRKYLKEGEDSTTMVRDLLLGYGADEALAEKVQLICLAVSYSSEIKDREYVIGMINKYPELAIVQDADRLDSIGAIGIGRVFSYGAAKTTRGMGSSVDHFDEKLLKLEAMMKTAPGKRMAKERTEELKTFKRWWDNEINAQGEIDWYGQAET